ncbi:type II/IV secretion system ATPase subunit [Methanolobus zinderi]|uniref:Type II/IV secretion system ATPase subunit n=1 Tax=Methanolobus zinderi TaxID=536044 RepID=A0A7D5E686_9EURY|nr:type II/IV secretion system ATPase subunit [Methanolobus zinderi]QLC49752.1 type II/IV secretion system ATPase subunit [Methanolobus zinderi]
MADAQIEDPGKKELEDAKETDEADELASTYDDLSEADEGSSDSSDDLETDEDETDDSLETSNLLEKLAEIKESDQKLEEEFTSIIKKSPLKKELEDDRDEEDLLFSDNETEDKPAVEEEKASSASTTDELDSDLSDDDDELNILLPRSSGFGPKKTEAPVKKKADTLSSQKDEEAKARVKSILEEKAKEENIVTNDEEEETLEDSEVSLNEISEEKQKDEEEKGFFGKIKKLFKQVEFEMEPYDPELHGPITEFKGVEGYEEIDRYWVNEPYTLIVILYNEDVNNHLYYVVEPELSDFEEVLLNEIMDRLRDVLLVEEISEDEEDKEKVLDNKIWSIIQDYTLELTPAILAKISYYIKRDFVRFGKIDALMYDDSIEDVSGNGHDVPIFLYHRVHQNIATNIVYGEDELNSFIIQMAQRSGKHISVAEPMIDATMPDGSRIQMTLGTCVTAHGSTFTIRKFSDTPITPVDLIKWGTFSAEAMAYLWLCIENNKSLIYAGGTASGKTSSLNAVSLFIPEKAKIITLEDTRELKLPHPNWIPSITRDSFTADERGAVDMYDLLKAALRQRPEYLLVGEVRGKEALTLFQAMSTGHTTFSTMHADSVASAIHRLENPPISVPRTMIQALDIMSIQAQTYTKGKRVRRNLKLVEIIDIDPNTRNIRTNDIFVWDSESDVFVRTGESKAIFDIKMRRGWGQSRIDQELYYRQKILEYMVSNEINDFNVISGIINAYQSTPEKVLKKLQLD